MKLLVVSEQGRIVAISKLEDVGVQPSGIVKFGVIPGKGQRADHVELPPGLRKEALIDLHSRFRVELKGKRALLVDARSTTERSQRKK